MDGTTTHIHDNLKMENGDVKDTDRVPYLKPDPFRQSTRCFFDNKMDLSNQNVWVLSTLPAEKVDASFAMGLWGRSVNSFFQV